MNAYSFVSYKAAELLKELGFNEDCYGEYDEEHRFWERFTPVTYDDVPEESLIAPQVWLVEYWLAKNFEMVVESITDMDMLEKILENLCYSKK